MLLCPRVEKKSFEGCEISVKPGPSFDRFLLFLPPLDSEIENINVSCPHSGHESFGGIGDPGKARNSVLKIPL